jgi:flavin-dependent thymidylate synthase
MSEWTSHEEKEQDYMPPENRSLPVKWADEAMYAARPITYGGEPVRPKVTLVSMTANPLRVMAAASELYQGGIYDDPRYISHDQALKWLDGFKSSKISAPLEFINLHFFISGVTRAFTHQLVRQRTAVFVQESMRFAVKENAAFEVPIPPSLANTEGGQTPGAEDSTQEWQRNVWDECVSHTAQAYLHLIGSGMPAEEARGLLPTDITTRIHYHTDLRNLVNQAGMRLCSQAQAEWKHVWDQFIRAIMTYGPPEESWQQREIARLFKPVCYQTGHCGFNGPADRWCVIRDRVNAHSAAGDAPDTWTDIDPVEPLHHNAARKPMM